MDPFTVAQALGGLITLATATSNRFDQLEGLLDDEREILVTYKRRISALHVEMDNARSLFNTIILHGDTAAVNSLLKSVEGQSAFARLSEMLDSVERLLKLLMKFVDHWVTELRREKVSYVAALQSVVLDRDLKTARESLELVRNSLNHLEERKNNLRSTCDHFKELYDIHNSRQSRWQSISARPAPVIGDNRDINALIETIRAGFAENPFQLGFTPKEEGGLASSVHSLDHWVDWGGQLENLMKGLGFNWVDDQVPETTSGQSLGDVDVNVFQKMQMYLLEGLRGMTSAARPRRTEVNLSAETMDIVDLFTQDSLEKVQDQRYSIAFCGMVKAGKSMFLNALIGMSILPSGDLPATAWPVRIRHTQGQIEPTLSIDVTPFQAATAKLRAQGFSDRMEKFKPLGEDPFLSIFEAQLESDNFQQRQTTSQVEDAEIHRKWIDLDPSTKYNLKSFESKGYRMNSEAKGKDQVARLLNEINDVVRLCLRLGVPFDTGSKAWPVLCIELEALRGQDINGTYEFFDLPGIGEYFEQFTFEDLVRSVSNEVGVFVPIVSYKEIPQETWRCLPKLIESGATRRPDLAVCTHLDQFKRNIAEIIAKIGDVIWPKSAGARERVLPCSSKMGLSAQALARMSHDGLPEFDDFWHEEHVAYDCAKEILGVGSPRKAYNAYNGDAKEWKDVVDRQLTESRLPRTAAILTKDMVVKAQQRILMHECGRLLLMAKKLSDEYQRKIIEFRRSERDFKTAYDQFHEVKRSYQVVLANWKDINQSIWSRANAQLNKYFNVLETEGHRLASKAVDETSKELAQPGHEQKSSNLEDIDIDFTCLGDAEKFLHASQKSLHTSLNKLKGQFVSQVRNLAERSRREWVALVKKEIKDTIKEEAQPWLTREIVEELDILGASVSTLLFSTLSRQVMKTIQQRHNASSAFNAVQSKLARPFLDSPRVAPKLLADLTGLDDLDAASVVFENEREKSVQELGFLLRAPIAVIATIPVVLGAAIWPFMIKSRTYQVKIEAIKQEFNKKVVDPFLEALKTEGDQTLRSTMLNSSEGARQTIEDALQREEERYENEKNQKGRTVPKEEFAATLAVLVNFLAAKAAAERLREYLKQIC